MPGLRRWPLGLAQALGLLGPWILAQDPRHLCKRLHLSGYEHLVAAEQAGSGLRLRVEKEGPWLLALWVVAYYRGIVTLLSAETGERKAVAGLVSSGLISIGGDPKRQPPSANGAERFAWLGPSGGGDDVGETVRARAWVAGKAIHIAFEIGAS